MASLDPSTRVTVVSAGQALLIFGGIPIGLAVIISLAVWVGTWSGRSTDPGDLVGELPADDVLFVVSATSAPDPGHLPVEPGLEMLAAQSIVGGGARGRW